MIFIIKVNNYSIFEKESFLIDLIFDLKTGHSCSVFFLLK